MSDVAQRQAIAHGFRPANQQVRIGDAESPFVRFASSGIRVDVPGRFVEAPDAETLKTLQIGWQRS